MRGQVIPISTLLPALSNVKQGTLREVFLGEEPDFIQERDKECTGITMKDPGEPGFSASFDPPIFLRAGQGYVFEEHLQE